MILNKVYKPKTVIDFLLLFLHFLLIILELLVILEVVVWLPCVLLRRISLPFDKEFLFAFSDPVINHFLYFIFFDSLLVDNVARI